MTSVDPGVRDAHNAPEDIKAVPVRHPGRWVAAAVLAVLVAQLVHFLVATSKLRWDVVRSYLFNHQILVGLERTVLLTVGCMAIGVALGVTLAVMRMSPNPVVKSVAWLYIWFFRGTPVLVQLLFWFFLPTVIHSLSFGVPFGPSIVHADAKTVITQLWSVLLGLGLNEAAYMSEIARAGILSVDEGQTEAAQALGMRRVQTLRRIVLPQAMRVIIPPTGNETISMLKTTSLASTIGYLELLGSAQLIYARNYLIIPLLLTVSIWYLVLTSVSYVGQYYLERRFGRGTARDLPPTPLQRLRVLGFGRPAGGLG
ncbi:amino acid ABC transporter permease [Acidiferrimicrobium sp. IK]|uniref:amino acid ABC transporter permease n=1 Tax=Acidiferrimicrobium sp. IK TaxID=2871700 RepID=UPI0021CB2E22|nr:amino acid ABC transporter permease [Acidiferrimicrobium sp. IK]MCU4186080.1 amino acid ABC transporter permease [Acidiferrimicrobium sp. IK]